MDNAAPLSTAATLACLSSGLSLVFLVRARRRLKAWQELAQAAALDDPAEAATAALAWFAGSLGARAAYLLAVSQGEGEPVLLAGWSPGADPEAERQAVHIAARVLGGQSEVQGLRLGGTLALSWLGGRSGHKAVALAMSARPLFQALQAAGRRPAQAGEEDGMRRFAALGKLAAGVAHELNTPLATILTGVSRLSRSTEDPALSRRLELISRAVDRCRMVVEKLMLYARRPYDMVDQGLSFSRLVWAEVELNRLVEDTLELHRDALERARIDLRMELGQVPPLMADPGALVEALGGLIANAVQAVSLTAEPRLRVATGREGQLAYLTMGDNGSPHEGRDLGSAILREVAERHGGRLEICAQPGQGTVVRLYLALQNS